jgi:methionyl-tRNA formyltransferase
MRVIFLGTPQFAVPVLQAILAGRHKVILAITQPDKANARGNKTVFSPLKVKALEEGIPLAQYERVSGNIDKIAPLSPDIMVTAGFGQLLSEELIALPKYGVINVHGSLLPKYRGASPVQSALLNGEKEIGVTIMNTRLALDAGEIILQQALTLSGEENAGECLDKLAIIGGELAVRALDLIEEGKAQYTPQDDSKATYCGQIKKEEGKLDFKQSAEVLKNKVRAFTPSPSAYIMTKIGRLKVLDCRAIQDSGAALPGSVMGKNPKEGLIIKCGEGALKLLKVQPEGGKAMSAADFLRGRGSALVIGENIADE